jgi:tellurite methyltransferase
MSRAWTRYYEAAGDDPRETLLFALERFELEGRGPGLLAVDLGCGSGRDTAELLRRGWRVLAIDSDPEGIARLLRRSDLDGDSASRLETQVASFEDAVWPDADLVSSSFALPFCPPDQFGAVWRRIIASLRTGGRFCGQLFGDRDEWARRPSSRAWASPPAMTFNSRAEVEVLLRELDVERFDEVDTDGTTAVGESKHWHVFHVVARKHRLRGGECRPTWRRAARQARTSHLADMRRGAYHIVVMPSVTIAMPRTS